MRHRAVLDKYSRLDLPHTIYHWVEAFFRGYKRCNRVDLLHLSISFNIIQYRPSVCHRSSVVNVRIRLTASCIGQLHGQVHAGDLIIPAVNARSCATEITPGLETWAAAMAQPCSELLKLFY